MTASNHLVHGLSGQHTAPEWPPLRLDELVDVLASRSGMGRLERIVWHSPRPLAAAAVIETTHGRFFVKRQHRTVRTAATLGEEHAFIAHLRERAVLVPAVLEDDHGQTVTARGEWVYEVHAPAAGTDLYRDVLSWEPLTEIAHAHAAGRMLADLQQAAADYRAPQRDTHILVARSELIRATDPIAALHAQLPQRPGLADYLGPRNWTGDLATALTPWHARSQPALAELPTRWTHGDWHASNLGWSVTGDGVEIRAVFDFGLAAANFALFDLATAIERNAVAWLVLDAHAARPDIALALIAGYRERLPLSVHEVHLLADLLPLVHIDFALSEVEYYHSVTGSKANADLAYGAFLQGHAAWFRSAAGRALLDAIRGYA